MPIFDRQPTDWSDLQELVGQLFRELGCKVEIGKTVDLARGQKEIDVWVLDASAGLSTVLFVECKYWARPVPQEVIHAFRTVVSDAGASRGLIVSRAGFQSGAHEAARLTSIDLVTFDGLQQLFLDRWKIAIATRMMPYADRLFPYWDPTGGRTPAIAWDDSHRIRHRQLMAAYSPLIDLGPAMAHAGFTWHLPIEIPPVPDVSSSPITLTSYRQVYDFIDENKDRALNDFRRLYGELDAAPEGRAGAG